LRTFFRFTSRALFRLSALTRFGFEPLTFFGFEPAALLGLAPRTLLPVALLTFFRFTPLKLFRLAPLPFLFLPAAQSLGAQSLRLSGAVVRQAGQRLGQRFGRELLRRRRGVADELPDGLRGTVTRCVRPAPAGYAFVGRCAGRLGDG
jgi:hypothetical protein